MYYYVVYEQYLKADRADVDRSCIILKDVHPLVWCASPPELYAKHYFQTVLFWTEIPEEVARHPKVQQFYGVSEFTDPR